MTKGTLKAATVPYSTDCTNPNIAATSGTIKWKAKGAKIADSSVSWPSDSFQPNNQVIDFADGSTGGSYAGSSMSAHIQGDKPGDACAGKGTKTIKFKGVVGPSTLRNTTPTSTALTSTADTYGVNDVAFYTATVSPSSATGNVLFAYDGGLFQPVALSGGQAQAPYAGTAVGSHTISAQYEGDAKHSPSSDSRPATVEKGSPYLDEITGANGNLWVVLKFSQFGGNGVFSFGGVATPGGSISYSLYGGFLNCSFCGIGDSGVTGSLGDKYYGADTGAPFPPTPQSGDTASYSGDDNYNGV